MTVDLEQGSCVEDEPSGITVGLLNVHVGRRERVKTEPWGTRTVFLPFFYESQKEVLSRMKETDPLCLGVCYAQALRLDMPTDFLKPIVRHIHEKTTGYQR